MNFNVEKFNTILQSMPHCDSIVVGLSGGIDSVVLLQVLHSLKKQGRLDIPLRALHIHHGLHIDADAWKAFCEKFCAGLDVPLEISEVHVEITEPRAVTGLENAARNARYRAFESSLEIGEALLLAHHLDDQLETFLLRLMRGAGIRGLAGMPRYRLLANSFLFRPLLDFSRESLIDYARACDLEWIEDNSNQDVRFDRNYCRHKLLPLIEQRWTNYRESWNKSLILLGETDELLKELAEIDLNFTVRDRVDVIGQKQLLRLSDARRRNALRRWFGLLGLEKPGWNQLQQLSHTVASADAGGFAALSFGACLLYCFKGNLYALRRSQDFDNTQKLTWQLEKRSKLELSGNGILRAESVLGSGIRASNICSLNIKYRTGGEACQLVGRPTKRLKKLLQEEEVLPWLRERLPLLYLEDDLACIPGIGVAERYAAPSNEQGLLISWEAPDFSLSRK